MRLSFQSMVYALSEHFYPSNSNELLYRAHLHGTDCEGLVETLGGISARDYNVMGPVQTKIMIRFSDGLVK